MTEDLSNDKLVPSAASLMLSLLVSASIAAALTDFRKVLFQRVNSRRVASQVSFLRHAELSCDEQLLLETGKVVWLYGEPSILGRPHCAHSSQCGRPGVSIPKQLTFSVLSSHTSLKCLHSQRPPFRVRMNHIWIYIYIYHACISPGCMTSGWNTVLSEEDNCASHLKQRVTPLEKERESFLG